jgi:hypothetical protein
MPIESDIYSDLTSSTLITAQTSNRVYPVWIDQETPYPYISYFREDSESLNTFDGYTTNLNNINVEINVFTTSYATTKTLRDNVLTVLDASTRISAMLERDEDLFEAGINTDKKVYRVLMDFSVWGTP